MKYQVPQFIEIEDKIFGPLTLKQFLYMAGGSSISFIIWSVLPKFIAIILIIPIFLFFVALAFFPYNQRPLITTVENALKFLFTKKLHIWKKTPKKPVAKNATAKISKMEIPKMSASKLKELTWSLDINRNINSVENRRNSLNL
jgi:hypothetical protein